MSPSLVTFLLGPLYHLAVGSTRVNQRCVLLAHVPPAIRRLSHGASVLQFQEQCASAVQSRSATERDSLKPEEISVPPTLAAILLG
jgi:hypothetical protein